VELTAGKSRALSVKKYISSKEDILPIAVDLIRKEFPLRIRLLGIRMSNLKDLTVPDTGIRTVSSGFVAS
jgi:DNA polymerase kappa